MAGGNVTLTCSVTLPHGVTGTPEIQWDGPGGVTLNLTASGSGDSSGSGQAFISSGGEQTVSSDLPLSEITTSQAGQYTCTATLRGSITTSTNITVESEFSRALSSMILPLPTLSVSAPTPEITASVTGTVSAGAPLNLTCHYTLSPSVDTDLLTAVTWTVNGTAIDEGLVSSDGVSLIFSPLTTSDTGNYTCTVYPVNEYVVIEGGPKESELYPLIVHSK